MRTIKAYKKKAKPILKKKVKIPVFKNGDNVQVKDIKIIGKVSIKTRNGNYLVVFPSDYRGKYGEFHFKDMKKVQ